MRLQFDFDRVPLLGIYRESMVADPLDCSALGGRAFFRCARERLHADSRY